jgi:hypothetical protein
MTEMPSINAILMPIMMVLICAMNLFWSSRRTEGRFSIDAARLQAALTEELYLLGRLYRSNLDLLDRAEVRLLSTRVPLAIFRANVPRLTLLEEEAIRCLVAVHANNEHIEMMVAERAKSIKNGQCTIYVFEKDEPSLELFRALFQDGAALVERAIEALEARGASSASFAGTTARLLGFTAPKSAAAELAASPARPASLPASVRTATVEPAL